MRTRIDSIYENGDRRLFYHENNRQWKLGYFYTLIKKFNARNTAEVGISLDGRISFKQNKKQFSQEWALVITNITDHKNFFSKHYDTTEKRIVTEYQQRFFPMMLYRINF